MKKVAIVGAGIVGATTAFYLSRQEDVSVTVFDHGQGQATKAAAGIISPWFSKRRNQAWYRLARMGADFYQDLLADLEKQGQKQDFYRQTGVLLLKKDAGKLEELYELALRRKEESPLIGELKCLSKEEIEAYFPGLCGVEQALYASGGARVDGALLTRRLLEASPVKVVSKNVSLSCLKEGYEIDGQFFDEVVLATGAWLGELLSPLGYRVDVRPQKGQLRDYKLPFETQDYPVVMPEGEWDFIPFEAGALSLGASHENDKGFDLAVDEFVLDKMEREALLYYPQLQVATFQATRVGTRAYTSDFSPFFGQVPQLPKVYVASGLGSSGLTTGPFIGWHLAQLVLGKELILPLSDYPAERYIQKRTS